ncbi:uncharacterized protein L201_004915 [Kwoniella dendrophila CBS 6074]|uniref:Shugoshin C-terminal domain-containing protein n=1 Tax=Kwoniella dendrophila CBS 6074 TaxID=1295534 RepID=A0AAX4JZL7_9TREE
MTNQPISPEILTPVTDHPHDPPTLNINSDNDERIVNTKTNTPQQTQQQPVSLLTALIHSSDNNSNKNIKNQNTGTGILSSHSSTPSTAFSSPRSHGILQQSQSQTQQQQQGASILRRESNSGLSDDGNIGLGLKGMETLKSRLENIEEKRERIGWAADVEQPPVRSGLKFAVASHPNRPSSSTNQTPNLEAPGEAEYDTDEGYQEDEEDGFDSDSSQDSQINPRFPFARPTNFEQHPRYIGSTHIPTITSPGKRLEEEKEKADPAPSLLPPPSRRGRGHIRVDENTVSENAASKDKICSRHRSPPPARSRSISRSSSRHQSSSKSAPHSPSKSHPTSAGNGRLSDAGPRSNRAGSPMPSASQLSELDDDEEDLENDDDDDEEDAGGDSPKYDIPSTGWRSDDAVFYGPKARQVTPIARHRPRRHSSALDRAVFVDSDDDGEGDVVVDGVSPQNSGISGFLRRASEHIPGFRRPSSGLNRSSTTRSTTSQAQIPCPPALDNTPAMAQNNTPSDLNNSTGGLTHRLENALSIPSVPSSAAVSRSTSLNKPNQSYSRPNQLNKQSQSENPTTTTTTTTQHNQINRVVTPQSIPNIKFKDNEQLGWTDEALLEIRKSRKSDQL